MSATQKKSKQLKRPIRSSGESSDSEEEPTCNNKFADDGSFLEMFKKMQQQNSNKSIDNNLTKETGGANEPKTSSEAAKPIETKRKPKVLKVGIIKKKKSEDAEDEAEQKEGSAWDHYMKEVRTYKAKFGDDEDKNKNRPLVK